LGQFRHNLSRRDGGTRFDVNWLSESRGSTAESASHRMARRRTQNQYVYWEKGMTNNEAIGVISELWRFPVKSMQGEQHRELELVQSGVLGDRAYALIDNDTGKVVSAKSVKLFPRLFECKAAFVEPPRSDATMPPVLISLPDGVSVRSDAANIDSVLSAFFKRNVTLARAAPADFTIDQYHPDVDGADPGGNRDVVVDQKLGSALFAAIGMDSAVPEGSFLDVFPLSLMTTSTLSRLNVLEPQSRFEQARFRMNVIVKTDQAGFVENDWVGHGFGLGSTVQIGVALPDPRCVMTTLAQGDLPRDTDVLRALVRHNKIQVGDLGEFPCAGVYCVVSNSGMARTGDSVVPT
jgi:hypothetical protein